MSRIERLAVLLVGIVLVVAACDGDPDEPARTAPVPPPHEQGEVNCFMAAVVHDPDEPWITPNLRGGDEKLEAIAQELFPSESFREAMDEDEFDDFYEGCIAGLELAGVEKKPPQEPPANVIVSILEQSCRNEILANGRADPEEYLRFIARPLDARSSNPDAVAEAFVDRTLAEAKRAPLADVLRSALTDACAAGYREAITALDR